MGMSKQEISVVVTYDDKMQGSFDYAADRIASKINKVLGEFSKETFSGSFAITPVKIKEVIEKEKKNAKNAR